MIRVGQFSTWNEYCGVARNAHSVHSLLNDHVDIVPLPLKRSVMLADRDKYEIQIADDYFQSLLDTAKTCDVIIWQHEPGLLGRRKLDYLRRSRQIRNLQIPTVIVFHTIPREISLSSNVLSLMFSFIGVPTKNRLFKIKKAIEILSRSVAWHILFHDAKVIIKRAGVAIIHTEEDAHYLKKAVGIQKFIVAAPSNITTGMRQVRKQITEYSTESRHSPTSRIQDIFDKHQSAFWIAQVGFINSYKGLDFLIETLKLLPTNFRVIVAGGVHERSADDFISAHPITSTILQNLGLRLPLTENEQSNKISKQTPRPIIEVDPTILNRIHFIGSPTDEEIAETIIGSDACALLYRNVNQSASGPLVESLELGATIVASNNQLFRRFRGLAGKQMALVDIGNLLQTRDAFLGLESSRNVTNNGGYRFVSYPWSEVKEFRIRFSQGYSEAFELLGFTDLSNSLRQ